MEQETRHKYAIVRSDIVAGDKTFGKNMRSFVHSFALLRVAEELRAHGISAGDILVYLEMMWVAGEDLDFPVPATRVADALCRTIQSVRRSIVKLKKKDVIKEEHMNEYKFTRMLFLRTERLRAMKTKNEA